MPYSTPTLAEMTTDLARSLGDPDMVFWVEAELEGYCIEALRTWNCFANYWRNRRQFTTVADDHLYDLVTEGLVAVPSDQSALLRDLQYALVEPASTLTPPYNSFITTEQYSAAQINSAILQALKQFQFDSGMRLTIESPLTIVPSPSYVAELDENVCDVRHVNLTIAAPEDSTDGTIFPIRRMDEFAGQFWRPNALLDQSLPEGYSFLFTGTQPSIRLIPAPSIAGEMEVISIRSNSMPPVDFQWPAKWLALSYLLTMDGQSRDNQRAEYCRKRYEDAVRLASLIPSVGVAYINNRPAQPIPATDMDLWSPGWRNQSLSSGQAPTDIIQYGWNVIGVHKTPTVADAVFDISLELFVEAPVDEDVIQIAPEHLQAVLDYAKHLAVFKLGGSEFAQTLPLYERFVAEAMQYNSKLLTESKNFNVIRDRAAREKEQRYPRRAQTESAEQLTEGGS
jgi:hypothetical protein